MVTKALTKELHRWRDRLESKMVSEGLDRLEQADLDFLNDRLARTKRAASRTFWAGFLTRMVLFR